MTLKYIVSSCAILAFLNIAAIQSASAAPYEQNAPEARHWPNAGESGAQYKNRVDPYRLKRVAGLFLQQ